MIFTSIAEKASSYLPSTFVKVSSKDGNHRNKIAYISGGRREDNLVLHFYKEDPIPLTDKNISNWNFSSPKLGYLTAPKNSSVFVVRYPYRMWKMGVTDRNTNSGIFRDYDTNVVIKILQNAEDNNYWTAERATKTGLVSAVSENYAIDGASRLHFMGKVLGPLNNLVFSNRYCLNFHRENLRTLQLNPTFTLNEKVFDFEGDL